jgi:hypothetical protein
MVAHGSGTRAELKILVSAVRLRPWPRFIFSFRLRSKLFPVFFPKRYAFRSVPSRNSEKQVLSLAVFRVLQPRQDTKSRTLEINGLSAAGRNPLSAVDGIGIVTVRIAVMSAVTNVIPFIIIIEVT